MFGARTAARSRRGAVARDRRRTQSDDSAKQQHLDVKLIEQLVLMLGQHGAVARCREAHVDGRRPADAP